MFTTIPSTPWPPLRSISAQVGCICNAQRKRPFARPSQRAKWETIPNRGLLLRNLGKFPSGHHNQPLPDGPNGRARLLLQVRTRALDGVLRKAFVRWHPGMKSTAGTQASQHQEAAWPPVWNAPATESAFMERPALRRELSTDQPEAGGLLVSLTGEAGDGSCRLSTFP